MPALQLISIKWNALCGCTWTWRPFVALSALLKRQHGRSHTTAAPRCSEESVQPCSTEEPQNHHSFQEKHPRWTARRRHFAEHYDVLLMSSLHQFIKLDNFVRFFNWRMNSWRGLWGHRDLWAPKCNQFSLWIQFLRVYTNKERGGRRDNTKKHNASAKNVTGTEAEIRRKNHRDVEFHVTHITTWPFGVAVDFYPLQITDTADSQKNSTDDSSVKHRHYLWGRRDVSCNNQSHTVRLKVWWVFFLYLTSLWTPRMFRWQL